MLKERKVKIVLVGLLSIAIMFVLSNYSVVRADDADGIWKTDAESTSTGTETTGSTSSGSTSSGSTSSGITSSGSTSTNYDWDSTDDGFEDAITESSEKNNTSNNSANNTSNTYNVLNNTSNNTLNNTSTTSNSNSLAKTGIEDSKGTLAIILVVSGIVGVYSFRKLREYSNM